MIIEHPVDGTLKIKKKFAFVPTRLRDLKHNQEAWLQYYYVIYCYSSFHGNFEYESYPNGYAHLENAEKIVNSRG